MSKQSGSSKYDLLSLAGGLAKKVISPVDPDFIKRSLMQVWDIKAVTRDIVDGLVAKAVKQKDDVIAVVANEFSKFLQRINVSEELRRLTSDLSIHVDATIELNRRSNGKSLGKFSQKLDLKATPGKKRKKL